MAEQSIEYLRQEVETLKNTIRVSLVIGLYLHVVGVLKLTKISLSIYTL